MGRHGFAATASLAAAVVFAVGCEGAEGGPGLDAAPPDGGAPFDSPVPSSCQEPFGVTQVEPGAVNRSAQGTAYLFAGTSVHHFDIQVAESDLATLDRDPRAEAYVPATVRFEGFEYRGAALRYKGGFNTLQACFDSTGTLDTNICRKLSLKLSFNERASCGRFFGVRKVVLNAMSLDPTLLHERVGSVFRQRAGVRTPRVGYATASINGVHRGVFALVEEIDHAYLEETYADPSGDLYKSVWPRYPDISRYKEKLQTNRDKSDGSTMMALYLAVNTATEADFAARTAGLVDAAGVARRLAVGYIVGDHDGPAMFYYLPDGTSLNGNYYWYDNPGRGFELISWDTDADFELTPTSLDPGLFTEKPASCEPMLICEYEQKYFGLSGPCDPGGLWMLHPACDPLIRLSVTTNPTAYQAAINDVAAAYADGTILARVDAAIAQLETVIAAERAWGVNPAIWRARAEEFRDQMVELGAKVRAAAQP